MRDLTQPSGGSLLFSRNSGKGSDVRRVDSWIALALAFLAFAATSLTIRDYGLIWDEPYYFTSEELQRTWIRLLFDDPSQAMSAAKIDEAWNFDPYHNPHPPLYKIASNLTWLLTHRWVDCFLALRLAGPLWFAALVAGLYLLMRELAVGGRAGAGAAAAFLMSLPHVFAQAHFVATDVPIAALTVLASLLFVRSRGGRWSLPTWFGVVFGLAIATKFSAFLIPVPLALWAVAGRERWAWRPLAAGALLGPLVAIAVNPGWWLDPVGSLVDYFVVSMSRARHTPISLIYWGRIYPFHAPWHEPWVMLALTTPLPTLALALAGIAQSLRRRFAQAGTLLLLASFLVPLLALMLPSAPHHDGVRMFLPALPFLCGFAGLGFAALWDWTAARTATFLEEHKVRAPLPKLLVALAALCLSPAVIAVAAYHPHELSYYNEILGGIRGAYANGMEVTYWMEVFTPRVLRGIETALPAGAVVNPIDGDPGYFRFHQKHGRLRKDVTFATTTRPDAYSLIFNRMGTIGMGTMARARLMPHVYEYSFRGVPLVILMPGRSPA